MHSIFQISISHNTICADMVDFRKPGHICSAVKLYYSEGAVTLASNCSITAPRDSSHFLFNYAHVIKLGGFP